MVIGWSDHGIGSYLSKTIKTAYKDAGNCKHHEWTVCSVYRLYYNHFDGTDFNCIKTDCKNQGLDPRECDAGEESQGSGGGA